MMRPILCIGRIDGVLTVETKRWLWKPGRMLARRDDSGTLVLLYHRDRIVGPALRATRGRWLFWHKGRLRCSQYREA